MLFSTFHPMSLLWSCLRWLYSCCSECTSSWSGHSTSECPSFVQYSHSEQALGVVPKSTLSVGDRMARWKCSLHIRLLAQTVLLPKCIASLFFWSALVRPSVGKIEHHFLTGSYRSSRMPTLHEGHSYGLLCRPRGLRERLVL